MKKQMIAAVFMASFAVPAFADNFEAQVFDTQPEKMKVAELSQQEMKETEGAFISITGYAAVDGALVNMAGYNAIHYINHGELASLRGTITAGVIGGATATAGKVIAGNMAAGSAGTASAAKDAAAAKYIVGANQTAVNSSLNSINSYYDRLARDRKILDNL